MDLYIREHVSNIDHHIISFHTNKFNKKCYFEALFLNKLVTNIILSIKVDVQIKFCAQIS